MIIKRFKQEEIIKFDNLYKYKYARRYNRGTAVLTCPPF